MEIKHYYTIYAIYTMSLFYQVIVYRKAMTLFVH